jgi:hypothetical protein
MRITRAVLVSAALCTIPAFCQGEDKTFYFPHAVSTAEMNAVTMTIRTIVDLQEIMPDAEHQSLQAHGPVDKLVAADWLFHQLYGPGTANPSAEYKFSGPREEVARILRVSPQASVQDITAVTTAIRTVVDIQRLFPLEYQKVLVARAAPDKIAAAAWLVEQLLPFDGAAPTADSQVYPSPVIESRWDAEKPLIRVLRMDPKATAQQLTAAVTAIRTVADLQRVFPFQSGNAIIASGAPERVAVAEWLVHELAKPPDASSVHQITMPSLTDGVVRLFFVPGQTDVTPLVSQIRQTLQVQRIFPFSQPPAVIMRGRPDEVSIAALLVQNFADKAH